MRLDAFLASQDKIILEDRQKTLISLGLTEKEYAPEGELATWKYPQYEYRNGKKQYYREVAIQVTDHEWELILDKLAKVQEIKDREAAAQKKKNPKPVDKKWIPVYEFPKKTNWVGEEVTTSTSGKSQIARVLRWIAWLGAIGCIIAAIVVLFVSELFSTFALLTSSAAIELLLFLALAEVLDTLAELRAIALQGFKYKESTK